MADLLCCLRAGPFLMRTMQASDTFQNPGMLNLRSTSEEPLLHIQNLRVHFGGIVALDGVSFSVNKNQICGLIGPNGAGKSTLFNCLSGLYRCNGGAITFNGLSLTVLPRHRMAAIGIGRTFQNLALFHSMTVLDNVMTGCHSHDDVGFVRNALRLGGAERRKAKEDGAAHEILEFLDLSSVAQRFVTELPFGTQKRVELARALATKPKLLLLDEPACGLNHNELDSLGNLITDLRNRFQITILLVEHHVGLVMKISDKVVVLNFGRKIADGAPAEIRAHPDVIRAYLGSRPTVHN
jgi:branched-chain amino acid transport system ATP-binding protein